MNELCLKECLSLIEVKLGWGSSQDWLNQDFELLSDRIFEETRVRLSVTTLKRVWGKVNYNSAPSISTLNALAIFLGFDNWSAFRQHQIPEPKVAAPKKNIHYRKPLVAAIALMLIVSTFLLLASGRYRETQPFTQADIEKVSFSSHAVTLGLPNSVVFQYDLAGLNPDSCFIQQSWNEELTFEIDKYGREATGIYYYPGYFRAKLIANNQILKEHDIHIRTKGWMGTIGTKNIPQYMYEEDIRKNNVLKLSEEMYEEVHATDTEEAPLLTYHYFNDFGSISSHNFEFQTRFRNTYRKSNGICQHTRILVQGKEGTFIIPFSIPGCISDLEIFMAGYVIDGKSNDLSAFGTDISNWQDLRLKVENDEVQIYLNNELIREFTTPYSVGDIVGFKYRFAGAGEIDYVKLSNDERVALEEDFGK